MLALENGRWTLSPPTLVLHHGRRNGRRWAGQGHPGLRVDDRNHLAGPVCRWLLEVHLAHVTSSNPGVDVRVGGGRRQGDGRRHLLNGLDLVLERRGVGGPAGQRGPVGGSRVDGVQLYKSVSIFIPLSFSRSKGRMQGCQQHTSSSVRRPGQNSKSSSKSKDRPASNLARKADTAGASASSLMLLTPRNWRWVFWVAILGPRRERPPWLLFEGMWAAGPW